VRLLGYVNQIDPSKLCRTYFVTNTTAPEGYTWRDWHAFVRRWLARLARRFPGYRMSALWRLERHGDGRPHMHALVFFVGKCPELLEFRDWNADAWCDVVKSEHPSWQKFRAGEGGWAGTDVQLMNTFNGVRYYMSKYVAKMPDEAEGLAEQTGRMWGWFRRDALPIKFTGYECSERTGSRVQRLLRRLRERRSAVMVARGCRDAEGVLRSFRVAAGAAARLREIGVEVVQRRRRFLRREEVPVWVEVDDGRAVSVKCEEIQKHSFAPSLSFVSDKDFWRIVVCVESQERWEREHGPPI
jgi:hypothetical protein